MSPFVFCARVLLASFAAIALSACTSAFDDLSPERGCEHARPPPVPAIGTDPMRTVDFTGAVFEYDVGERPKDGATDRFRAMGYDLDGTCTGQGQGPSCTPSRWATEPPRDDNPAGRDNAYGGLIEGAFDLGTSATDAVNSGAQSGSVTSVIRVRGYNETTVDSEVEVAIFGATLNELGTQPIRPRWDGTDVWKAGTPWWVDTDENGMPSTEHPKAVDRHAYVSESVLVAHIEQLEVPDSLHLSQVVLTARIVDDGRGWHLVDGTIAGRVNIDDILAGLQILIDPATGEYMCTDQPSYRERKRNICANADISWEGPDNPSSPCNAMSWGFTFKNTVPAQLSGTIGATQMRPCPPETSPENDSCERE
jgi:hypothetical protein